MPSQPYKVLLIGKGGREHALAWKIAQSPNVEHVYVVPGNGGTAQGLAKVSNVAAANGYPGLVDLAKKLEVGLVVVGPDQEVVDGIEGYFRESGIPCFAPSKEAAQLEGSKTFAKDFMQKYGIPTAAYRNFDDAGAALQYLSSPSTTYPIVVKASGLAAGKGVLICQDEREAHAAVQAIMVDKAFAGAGNAIVIEEHLKGDEISILTFSDGHTTHSLPPGQDHKRIGDGDTGVNTGGMGVYAPVPMATPAVLAQIESTILAPTFAGLRAEGLAFRGLLFTGIMLTPAGPRVLEYNTRFGDPETQSLLPLLAPDTDLADVLLACTQGRLAEAKIAVRPGAACNVIVAAGGYPKKYRSGDEITFGAMPEGVLVFHAGTKVVDGRVVTDGGRVLAVVGLGLTLQEAVAKAYEGVKSVAFEDMYYRTDIAHSIESPLRISAYGFARTIDEQRAAA